MTEAPPTLRARDGTTLYLHRWPAAEPRGVVLIAHGLGEHGGRYAEAAEALNAACLSVVTPDLRGHGRSQGPRVHVRYFHDFLDDLETVEAEACPDALPLVLWGHSMGGLIVLRYLQSRSSRARAAVVQAPWLGQSDHATPLKRFLGRMLGRVWPSARFPGGIRADMLTHDPERQAAWEADPLIINAISPRLFAEGTRSWEAVHAAPEALELPLLFLVPENDRLVDSAATLELASRLPEERTRVLRSSEWAHEVHQELDRAEVFRTVAEWIVDRLEP